MSEPINSFPDFKSAFGDKRLEKRAAEVLHKLTRGRSSSIRQVTDSRAQAKGFYRLLENEKFSEENIENSIITRCGELCSGRHVLAIQDTSETNLSSHVGRIKKGDNGIGDTSKKGIKGYFLHPCLVVDAEKGTGLGYSSVKVWHREEVKDQGGDNYKKLLIEDKESHKWIGAIEDSKEQLTKAKSITIIADREADIYDMFGRYGQDDRVKLLIRSKSNRSIGDGKETLIEHLRSLPVMQTYSLELRGDIRTGMVRRKVQMELKWTKVELRRPSSCNDKTLASSVTVYVVEAKEKGKKGGLSWRILTTHEIDTAEQALQIIEWYKQRWYIEQVFRLLKTQGFRIESSQLESGYAIRKLSMLALLSVLRIIQMMLAYGDEEEEQAIEEAFTPEEQQCLAQCNSKLEGDTEKQKNPNNPSTIKWATWIVARLGGWDGYKSQRKPGPIVLHRGFIKFHILYEGWRLAQNFFKDVGTQ